METTVTEPKETASRAKSQGVSRLGRWAAACLIVIIFLVATTGRNLPVMLPIMAAVGADVFFLWFLWRKSQGAIPFFEVGVVYVAVVSLYTLYPLTSFVANGLSYTPFNDRRLFLMQPTPQAIGTVGWYHVVHLASFIAVYLLVRGSLPREQARFQKPGWVVLVAAIVLYLAINGFLLFLNLSFGLSASSYSESYLVSSRLPLILAQLSNHLGGARFTLELVVLAALFGNYRKCRWLIAGWLIVLALATFLRLGSRTELVLFVISAAMMYHFLVRPIPFWVLVLSGLLGLCMFTWLGLLRSRVPLMGALAGFNPFAYVNEFESMFANAYDLSRLKAAGATSNLPPAFYLADLLALVPHQFIPFAKISPSIWYVSSFYPDYAAKGGGLAFGTISESILGGGWVDLVVRGAALGLILAVVYRRHTTSRPTFWGFIFYIWMTALVYQSFRNTTFSLLALFVYRFLPIWAGVELLSAFLKNRGRNNRRPLPGQV